MGLRVETTASDDLSVVILPSKTALRTTERTQAGHRQTHETHRPLSGSGGITVSLISCVPGPTDRGSRPMSRSPIFALAESSAGWSRTSARPLARGLLFADRHRGRRRESNKHGKREFLRLNS